jgi:hypothetical protein
MGQAYNNVDQYGHPLEGYAQQPHHDAYGQHGEMYPQDAYGQHGDATYGQHGDTYGQHMDAYGQQQQQHQLQQQQGHLDASQDDDFSPNARSRRIIREIIV